MFKIYVKENFTKQIRYSMNLDSRKTHLI